MDNMPVIVAYAVRQESPAAYAVLDSQLYAAGLRRNAGPGEHWCYVARAVDVLDADAAGLSYQDGIGYIMEWLGISNEQG